eukprot:CAMPEP_0196806962 /NCGR_PEP_ID=MMETSP1362-20130617/6899_1 /TAXON_ID=163516 /ORGANISM="Leptocylindrus danicus, Strain CCMP1856" /LENGTH=62 /DNA_ID=CAMNT_0042180667 /DNA_START=403 /DNA_END=591 /DNA_ORIENTATION=-
MTLQRIKILNYFGFVWDASDSRNKSDDEVWMRMLKELMKYKEKHDDCLVQYKCEEIQNWVIG